MENNRKLIRKSFWSIALFAILCVDNFLKKSINHGFMLGNVVVCCIILLLWLKSRNQHIEKNNSIWPYVLPFSVMAMISMQLIFVNNLNVRLSYYYLLCSACYVLFAKCKDCYGMNDIGFVLKIICLIGCVSIALLTGLNSGVSYRSDAIIDKSGMTLWISLALASSFVDILFRRRVLLNVLLFAFIFLFNLFVVQSKTAMLSIFIALVVLFVCALKEERKLILKMLIPVVCPWIVGILVSPETFLSTSMMVAFNHVTGSNFFHIVDSSRDLVTYEMRDVIEAYAFSKFLSSPLWGLGMGVYANEGGVLGVTECESTYLDFLVEGGLMLFVPMVLVLIRIFYGARKNIVERINQYDNYSTLVFVVVIAICFRWNDFIMPCCFSLLGMCSFMSEKRTGNYG